MEMSFGSGENVAVRIRCREGCEWRTLKMLVQEAVREGKVCGYKR